LSHNPSHLCFIFRVGSCFYAQVGLDWDPSIYAFCVPGMTDVYHHAQIYWLSPGWLQNSESLNLASQVARIIGMSHCAQPTRHF
jgi:hypothetical protein